jgi:hypothetical protein
MACMERMNVSWVWWHQVNILTATWNKAFLPPDTTNWKKDQKVLLR